MRHFLAISILLASAQASLAQLFGPLALLLCFDELCFTILDQSC
jgi:hypothetical protein